MKKIIGIVTLLFSMFLYAEQLKKDQAVPVKLKIIIGETSEQRFILVDIKKNKKISSIFKEATDFQEVAGKLISKVKMEDDKYGFIDNHGDWVFKPIFDEARTFSKENIARVKIGNKWGFIKANGTWLVKPRFLYVGAFKYDYAFVKKKNGLFHYINTQGKQAFKGNFSSASNFCKNEQVVVSINTFYGRVNNIGKVVEPFIHKKRSEAMKGCLKKDNFVTVNIYSIHTKNKKLAIIHDEETLKLFPSDIVSQLECNDGYIIANETVTMIGKRGGLVYFNDSATVQYYYASNKHGTMSLYDSAKKEIWRSKIKELKVSPCIEEDKEKTEEEMALSILQSSKLKWELPSNKICTKNGGKINNGVCSSNWSDAMKICKVSIGRLPTLKELEGFVMGCGGELKADDEVEQKRNKENSSYQACYKNNKFTSGIYWSSSYDADFAHYIWLIDFHNGSVRANTKQSKYNIQCVK